MSDPLNQILWHQFGAALDSLENAINHCPEEVWSDTKPYHQYWYWVYHTLFWTDVYLTDNPKNFAPPPPYGFEEFDPEGKMPPRIYSKTEMLSYLGYVREKLRTALKDFDEAKSQGRFVSESRNYSYLEMHLYNMRHVQHHTAQLNMLLRQRIDSAPRWVSRTKHELTA